MNQRVSTNTYKNKKVLVLGLGIEGMDLSKFLSSEGADLFISDQKSIEKIDAKMNEEHQTNHRATTKNQPK